MGIFIIGIIGQWIAAVVAGFGIAIEIVYKADLGFLAITIGSVIFGVATKLKVVGKEHEILKLKEQLRRKDLDDLN